MADQRGAIPKRDIPKKTIAKTLESASFQRSEKTVRTPPRDTEPMSQANQSVYLCQLCSIEDDLEKIRCDKCLLWYHFACANISKDVLNQSSWLCYKCTNTVSSILTKNVEAQKEQPAIVEPLITLEADNLFNISGLPPQPDQVLETTKNVERRSKKANSASSTMSRRATLALQKLEEERRMNEERDNEALEKRRQREEEYLKQKYSILEDDAMSNLSFDDTEVELQKIDAIHRWANDIPVYNNNSNPFETVNEMQLGVPHLNSTIVNPQISSNAVISSTNQISNGEPVNFQANMEIASSNLNTIQKNSVVATSKHYATTLPVWLTNPKTVEIVQKAGMQQSRHQMTVINNQIGNTSGQPIAGAQNVCSTALNISLNTTHQSIAGPTYQPSWQTTTVSPASQATSLPSSNLSPSIIGKTSSQTVVILSGKPAYQLVDLNQQMVTGSPQQVNASQPQFLGTNQPQPGFSQPQVLGTRQTANNYPLYGHGHHYLRQPCNNNHINGGNLQHVAASSINSQTPYLGYNQPLPSNSGQSASEPQQSDQNPPRTFGNSQSFFIGQPFGTSGPVQTSQSTSIEQSRSQLFDTGRRYTQVQTSGTIQNYSQTQSFDFDHSNRQAHSQTQFGFYQSSRQPHSQTQSFGFGQPNGSTQSFGNNQQNSQSQSFGIDSSIGNGQPYFSIGATAGQPLISGNNSIPVSQPWNLKNFNVGLNVDNGNLTAPAAIPGRLRAEQIASRYVIPKELPFFSGDITTWLAFISAYDNSTEECGLSNSENLARLQKCLKGDAHELVKTRLVHKDSVPGIIETLRMVYGRPELIIERMIQDIQRMPAPKEDDLSSLIKFAIAIQNLSTTIQNLRAFEHLKNPMLINSVTDKLPTQHRLNWAFYKRTIGDIHIGHLGDWLYEIADAASQVVRVIGKSSAKKPEQKGNKNKAESSKSNPFVNTQVEKKETTGAKNNSNSNQKKSCPACNSSKCTKLENCKKFKEATRTERWSIVKDGKKCGRCLGPHKFYRCQSSNKCSVDGCQASHHALLHNHEVSPDKTFTNNQKPSESKTPNMTESTAKTCNCQRSKSSQRTDKFRIIPVMLHNKDKSVRDYAYLDDGSNMTTIEESLADELELAGTSKELCVDWAFGQTHSTMDSRIVSMKISGYYDNAPRFKMTNVRTIQQLHLPTQSITSSWIEQYPHFKNVPIATYENVKPRLLIGLQYSKLTVSQQTVEGNENEPIACRTRLGWVVQGPTYESDNTSAKRKFSLNLCVCQSNDNELHKMVKRYFEMENIGTTIPETILESKEIQRAKEILQSTTIKKGNRYETGLLWKQYDVDLPSNYNMALKRLICLEAKMAKNPELKLNLFNQIKKFTEKGYIRKLSQDEIDNCRHRVWYLPTFPVFNPKKPAKVRLVWDGAAKVGQSSLNSNLLAGPDQLVPLPVLLRRFREREIGIIGDIEEMYHQVQVREEDQHVQRFLWRDNVNEKPDVYIVMVMTFGSKCSPSSAQYVKNKNAEKFRDKFPRAVEAIVKNHYVDDMIDCAESIDEAEKLVNEVKLIHKAGGFNIRNFASNSEELLTRIDENLTSQNKNLNISDEIDTERVLGMFWDTSKDVFTYSLKFTGVNEKMLSGEYCPTKREVLKILMSVFDPLGLIANFLVHGKILLQEIWRVKIEWDEKLPAPIHDKWLRWIKELPNVENLQIPRWYTPKLSSATSIQLHTFVDASVEACAAVSYLRIGDNHGIRCCLVGAKTKVAPTKPMTVPRLELQAAVLGTRLAKDVETSQRFVIQQQVFWSDSQTVMAWINSETRRYTQFVAFRIGEILESTEQKQWHWVPTKENVADEATKSKTIPKLDPSSRWFEAPMFLYDDAQTWSNGNIEFTTAEELRPCFLMSMREIRPQQLIDLNRFSQWNRVVRTQAFLLRFVYNVKTEKSKRRTGSLSQDELKQAENLLYQRAQRDVFLDEIIILKYNEKNPLEKQKEFEKKSELRTFSPYLDENNILRTRGRLDAAQVLSLDTKRPIILPRHHRITQLLVDWYHRRYKHANHQTALNEIRQKYIIPALRVVMKSIRNSCQKCKNSSTMPMIPEMAGLPLARLAAFTRPFTYTGLDYFGPFNVRQNRSTVKKYGVIFTCLTIRAVHLEVADTLNTSSCIKAIRRFAARKGEPREFFSDNGSNFHGAENELKEEFEKLDRRLIQQEFTSTEQKWTFNPPTASHMGGAWERLIQTVKSCLKQILTTKTPTYEMLTTLMAEVEIIMNSRPLTYVSLESSDDEALTPNHFLFGSSNAMKPIGQTTPRDLLRNDWKAIQEMTKHFWKRFVVEYMPDLTRRTKWFKQVKPIQVGDVVLLIDNRNPRNTWLKGLVEEVFPDRNGRIRHVMVKIGKRTLPRPVSKLAILDVRDRNNNDEMVKLPHTESVNEGENVANHPVNDNTNQNDSAIVLPDKCDL